jgi:hypothetical protein
MVGENNRQIKNGCYIATTQDRCGNTDLTSMIRLKCRWIEVVNEHDALRKQEDAD